MRKMMMALVVAGAAACAPFDPAEGLLEMDHLNQARRDNFDSEVFVAKTNQCVSLIGEIGREAALVSPSCVEAFELKYSLTQRGLLK